MSSLPALVRDVASTSPSAPALVDGATGQVVTYGELLPDDATDPVPLTFVLMRETVDHVRAYLAALARTGAVALVDPATPGERFAELVERYHPEHVLGTVDDLASAGLTTATDDLHGLAASTDGATATDAVAPHPELQLLLSTSGSTGSPKFVRLSAANVASNASAIATALHLDGHERAITCLPLHYTYGLSILHSHLAVGASIVCTPPTLLDGAFWEQVREHGVTSLAGVPFSYRVYDRLRLLDDLPPSLRSMTQAGGKLDAEVVERYARALADTDRRFYVMYGQTEATARMSVLPPELAAEHPDTAGAALPGGSFEIDPAAGDEVVYRGPNVMLGYATERADLAAGDELGGVLRTGDVGELTDEGLLRITGRKKRIAKLSGVRVSLDDVEASAATLGRIVAISAEDRILLVVEGDVEDDRALRREVAARTGLATRDFRVRSVPSIPTKSSGKTDYVRLEASL